MARLKQMQGVPAHLETLKTDGKRRHPSHCKFHKGKGKARTCDCERCFNYLLNCKSTAKCDYYEEMGDDK